MYKYRFVNYDKEAITEVLETVGKVRFEQAIKTRNLARPKELQNFKLRWQFRTCELAYKYQGDFRYSKIMDIKEYEMPEKGWIWEKYRD